MNNIGLSVKNGVRRIWVLMPLAMIVLNPIPAMATVRFDPANPQGNNFSVEGNQPFTSGPTLLSILDQSFSDLVNFYGSDPDAAPGNNLDLFATFQIRTTTPMYMSGQIGSNLDTGVRFVINDGQFKAVVAGVVTIAGVSGIALLSYGSPGDPSSWGQVVPVDWTSPTSVHIRRTAAGDAEIMEVNGVAPSPRAMMDGVSLPPRNRVNPTSEFGAGGVEALVNVDFYHFRTERPDVPPPPPPPLPPLLTGINGDIVFARNQALFEPYDLWVMDNNGGNQANLTNSPSESEFNPIWSPDGTQIAFEDGDEIYSINADGTGLMPLTSVPGRDTAPAWSPDGTKIAFASQRDALNMSIYVMNADGTDQTRITTTISDDSPAWSPDGTKIAFETQRGDVGFLINIMNADGSGRTDLGQNIAVGEHPAWSPDGTKIAFSSFRDRSKTSIYVMNTDGTGQTRLTNDNFDDNPAWSPDGTRIVFERVVYGQLEIFSMAADGTDQSNISIDIPGTEWARHPDWQRVADGGDVYNFSGFLHPVDELPIVNVVNAGQGVPVKFSLDGDKGLDIFATGYPSSSQIACDANVPGDVIEETVAAGGSGLSYDAPTDLYEYVWKTNKAWKGSCRILDVRLSDGSDYFANFRFK